MKDGELQDFFREFVKKRNMPVMLPEGDNEMLIDFECLDSVKIMLDIVAKKPSFKVEEFLFSEWSSPVKNGNTFFANEIISVLHK